MSHRKTQQEFEEECRNLYGDLDDLTFAKYRETSSKVKFVCRKHNIEYFQTPNSHKNNVFVILGFSLKYMELPDYKWSYANERFEMSDFVSTVFETEEDETIFGHSMDFLKVYDCGKEIYGLCP